MYTYKGAVLSAGKPKSAWRVWCHRGFLEGKKKKGKVAHFCFKGATADTFDPHANCRWAIVKCVTRWLRNPPDNSLSRLLLLFVFFNAICKNIATYFSDEKTTVAAGRFIQLQFARRRLRRISWGCGRVTAVIAPITARSWQHHLLFQTIYEKRYNFFVLFQSDFEVGCSLLTEAILRAFISTNPSAGKRTGNMSEKANNKNMPRSSKCISRFSSVFFALSRVLTMWECSQRAHFLFKNKIYIFL